MIDRARFGVTGGTLSRRGFVISSVLAVPSLNSAVVAQSGQATPGSSSASSFPELPRGIVSIPVNDEVDLLYFRVLPGFTGMTMLGEFQSKVDYWIAAPPILLQFGNGIELQPHITRPNIAPLGRGQFEDLGGFLDASEIQAVRDASLDSVEVTLCDFGFEEQADTSYGGLTIASADFDVDLDQGRFRATVEITNESDIPAQRAQAFALFYDEQGYYCGELSGTEEQRIAAGELAIFEIEEGYERSANINPLDFINRDPQVVFLGGYAPGVSLSCIT